MITLESVISELLSIEPKKFEPKVNLFNRIHNVLKRRDIEKQLQDERENDELQIQKLGKEAEVFLESAYYKDLIEPQIRQTIRGGFQRLLSTSDDMTDVQIRTELASMKKALSIFASIRLKIAQAKLLKEKNG